MKKVLVAAFAAAALALSATAQELGETIPTVTVNGSAQMKITPDVLYLNITLDESDTKGKVSLEEQRRNMFSVLKKIGIDAEKQLRVLDMSSSFFRKRGSLSSSKYELKVGSAAEARKVFEALDANGIPNVQIVRATNSKLDEYRDQVRAEAMRNAQSRARQLAEAVGQSIGMCYEITDYTTNVQPVTFRAMGVMKNSVTMDAEAGMADEYEPDVEFEQIVLNYNVTAKFILNRK